MDLKGSFYTWARMGVKAFVQRKLDQVFCLESCSDFWSSIYFDVLPRHHSDHSLMLITLVDSFNRGSRPFYFSVAWGAC